MSCQNKILSSTDKKARADMHCGMTVLGLRDVLAEIMSKDVHILKPHSYMMAVSDSLVQEHMAELEIKEAERVEKECWRIDKLLEIKVLQSSDVSSDECRGRFRALKKLEAKPKETIARCPSPSPIQSTKMIDCDSRYHSSVFLDPSIDLDSLKKGPTVVDEPQIVVAALKKYDDPILQKMSEQTSVQPLYDLAGMVVYRTSEGCKGILSSSTPAHAKAKS